MREAAAHAAIEERDEHLLLYDGVCGLCGRWMRFVLARDRRRLFAHAPLQSETGRSWAERFGRDPDSLTSFYVIADYQTPRATLIERSRAALFVASKLGWPWKATAVFRIVPIPLLDRVYDVVARHRYWVFGRHEHCEIPKSNRP